MPKSTYRTIAAFQAAAYAVLAKHLKTLGKNQTFTGEELVKMAIGKGLYPDDTRHFGHVINRLNQNKEIKPICKVPRTKGGGEANLYVKGTV